MIKQNSRGINSRDFCDPYNDDNLLPIITAPMSSIADLQNYKIFLENRINVCLPRKKKVEENVFKEKSREKGVWFSCSLSDFNEIMEKETNFIINSENIIKICIDTANGNLPSLHESIRKAKIMYGSKVMIMSGNVSSLNAFVELAKSKCDYIRVGIGGGNACTTTVHTGVGQKNLKKLIKKCFLAKRNLNLQTKIVADGISSYINLKNLHRNGYAAINNLIYAGADYVMIGSIFSKSKESAADKEFINGTLYSIFRGMSTQEEQSIYKIGNIKPSEGQTIHNEVEYSLSEWVNGSKTYNHDDFPGFVHALKSAMSYTGSINLQNFKFIAHE